MESSFKLESSSGIALFVRKWETDSPKSIALISHGMAEHSGRYANFANFLNAHGFVVYAHDHRGHGQTAGDTENLGFFAAEDGWKKVLEDVHNVHKRAQQEHPNLPTYIFGHSMGSLVVRHYLQTFNQLPLSGAIIIGTMKDPGLLTKAGVALSTILANIFGKKAKSKLMDVLTFGSNNKKFRPLRTQHDWLCRDESIVDAYVADPYCGGIVSLGFWQDFLQAVAHASSPENIKRTPHNLPMLFLSGNMDPVGEYGKGVEKVAEQYKALGVEHLQVKLYDGARHEILNEINKEDIYRDILVWIKGKETA